ncbi:PAS domain S-box protein [Nostoc sp. CHAB 5844]|nr:PAS domain S-box protein [Nostoc sp. CHAB 5844]
MDKSENNKFALENSKSAQFSKPILNQTIKFIGLMQPEGNLLEINQSALNFSGFTSTDVIGRPLWETCWWDKSKQTQTQIKTAVARAAAGESVHYEVEILGAGDRLLTFHFSIKPITNQQGQIIFLILQGQNLPDQQSDHLESVACASSLSGRQLNEQTLRENERRYACLAQISPVGIFRTDLSGNYLYVNERWCELAGRCAGLSVSQGWRKTIHPDDLALVDQAWGLSVPDLQPFRCEFRFRHSPDKIVWVFCQAVPETQANGAVIGYIGTIIDLSEQQQINIEILLQQRTEELTRLNTMLIQTTAMLQKRNQELDQFAYVASHDLKAPLRAIANLSQWLEEDLDGQLSKENQQLLNLLRGRVSRMEGLINGLLKYSRIGRIDTELSLVDVGELLQEVIDSLSPASTFKIEVASKMPTLITKRMPLQQVFTNLIENAIQHHSRLDGQVKISVQDQGRYYKFTVADDGPGIAAEYQPKVFTICQTLAACDRPEGSGMGLVIAKKIVETEGGTISLDSNSGIGSSFHFTWTKQSTE